MTIDPASLTDQQLNNLIENHQDKGVLESPLYLDALKEQEKRKGRGLDFEKSYTIIREAAAEGKFLSYKDLADESGAEWTKVHYELGSHLWRLVKYSHGKGWPMLSAIVVNKSNVKTGKMEPETLKGFLAAATELGIPFVDGESFLKEQQQKVFTWARVGDDKET